MDSNTVLILAGPALIAAFCGIIGYGMGLAHGHDKAMHHLHFDDEPRHQFDDELPDDEYTALAEAVGVLDDNDHICPACGGSGSDDDLEGKNRGVCTNCWGTGTVDL